MDDASTTLRPKSLTPDHKQYALNGRVMLCSVIIVLTIVLILFCFHTYSRWLSVHYSSRRRRRQAAHNRHNLLPLTADGTSLQGLDLSILKALPTFVYSSKTHEPPLECAVCLSEFQEDEKVRVLPRCKHTFHVDCIDMWFHSHSNCPTCRATVQPDNLTGTPVDATTVTVTELTGSGPEMPVEEECGVVCSSSGSSASFSPAGYQRKPSELVGVVVEVPSEDQLCRRLVDSGMGSGEQNGSKSPVNRAHPLKRIWSI